jgi:hypothetical protein
VLFDGAGADLLDTVENHLAMLLADHVAEQASEQANQRPAGAITDRRRPF